MSYLEDLRFSDSDIAYLESLGYHGAFLDYLRNFKLELTVRSAQEGDLVFANEPIVQVEGPLAQCQFGRNGPFEYCQLPDLGGD